MEPSSLSRSEAKAEELNCKRVEGNETGDYGYLPNDSRYMHACSFEKL